MKYVDSVDQDQTASSVQSDLDLHCPRKLLVSSSVRKKSEKIRTLSHTVQRFTDPERDGFSRHLRKKEENVGKTTFFLYPP